MFSSASKGHLRLSPSLSWEESENFNNNKKDKNILAHDLPTSDGGVQKKKNGKLGRNMRTLRTSAFARFDADSHAPVGAYEQKFSHRSTGGSLSRVRCWLGCGAQRQPNKKNPNRMTTKQKFLLLLLFFSIIHPFHHPTQSFCGGR